VTVYTRAPRDAARKAREADLELQRHGARLAEDWRRVGELDAELLRLKREEHDRMHPKRRATM
jgi:hypothetical protein